MTISIITLFPHFFDSIFSYSIINRAIEKGNIKINTVDLREFGIGPHKMVDDRPYGGGVGMVLRVDVMAKAIDATRLRKKSGKRDKAVILLDPKGKVFNQETAENLSKFDHLILICGHYEGFDERIRDLVDFEISAGDFILSGGEIAAALVAESVARLVPGVLKKGEATKFESFSKTENGRILEHPHYTRPVIFRGKKVPDVLTSGNFKLIDEYRENKAKEQTFKRRPDLK
jgi:tRNA (guanine37-N1)-methyltransferase